MTEKTLAEMTWMELQAALEAARQALQAADYQEGLSNWVAARRDAQARVDEVRAEIVRRRVQLARAKPEGIA